MSSVKVVSFIQYFKAKNNFFFIMSEMDKYIWSRFPLLEPFQRYIQYQHASDSRSVIQSILHSDQHKIDCDIDFNHIMRGKVDACPNREFYGNKTVSLTSEVFEIKTQSYTKIYILWKFWNILTVIVVLIIACIITTPTNTTQCPFI